MNAEYRLCRKNLLSSKERIAVKNLIRTSNARGKNSTDRIYREINSRIDYRGTRTIHSITIIRNEDDSFTADCSCGYHRQSEPITKRGRTFAIKALNEHIQAALGFCIFNDLPQPTIQLQKDPLGLTLSDSFTIINLW